MSQDRIRLAIARLRERLWVRPLLICLLSVGAVVLAEWTDGTELARVVPTFEAATVRTLLSILSSSMLVVATFAVGSMVAAYASASTTATPRAFPLIVADDLSQNALSTFVGAFIFSVVALTALEHRAFEAAGRFTVFVLTAGVFATVVLTFIRWVDRIARLGRLGPTIEAVERAAAAAIDRRRRAPTLCARAVAPAASRAGVGVAVFASTPGYVQHVDVAALQSCAERADARVVVEALPGTFVAADRPLARVVADEASQPAIDPASIIGAFTVGRDRAFDDDPRFGLVVLAEIAGRALSPAVNDPGTAIQVIGAQVRLLTRWQAAEDDHDTIEPVVYDRVEVPSVSVDDLVDDAFTVVARDGAGSVEVAVRLQKALSALAAGGGPLRDAAERHRRLALERAARAMDLPADLEAVQAAARRG